MNEDELKVNLVERLRKALPLLPASIKVEHYLKLRLGRRAMTIDGKEIEQGNIQGRYDLLVLLESVPLIVAELKAPDVALTEDDVAQALSYARVHQPMVPLALVSNGRDIRLLRSYDGAELKPEDAESERLKEVLKSASALAASTTEEAIRTLLGTSGRVWGQLFKSWSEEWITAMTGGVREFARPIPREFEIPRDEVNQIEDSLSNVSRLVVLHGPPLAGVTNVLAQFARSPTAGSVLLIDAASAPDVLQYVANRLSRELAFGVSKDDLRNWLNTRKGLLDITLAIDGLPIEGVEELVEFANAGLLRLVIGIGSDKYRDVSSVSGRLQQSLVGRSGVAIEVLPLSDHELGAACEILRESFGACFFNGAQHIPELRSPRKLRVVASMLPDVVASAPNGLPRDKCRMIPPIPGPDSLEAYGWLLAPDAQLKHDLRKLGSAFLADVSQHARDSDWVAATWRRPSVDPESLEAELGEPRVRRLCDLGFLSWVDTPGLGPRLLVRMEELLAHDVAEIWAAGLASSETDEALREEVKRLLQLAMIVPSGELSLASAIILASHRNDCVLSTIIPYLMDEKPTMSHLKVGSQVNLLVKDARLRLEIGEDSEERTIEHIGAWVVLSHLAALPFDVDRNHPLSNYSIFLQLGGAPHLIINPRPIEPEIAPGFHFHDFPGVGSLLCLNTGIVEPLVQSMIEYGYKDPECLELIAKNALERKDVHLGWRVRAAANELHNSEDARVAQASEYVIACIGEWWDQFFRATEEDHANKSKLNTKTGSPTSMDDSVANQITTNAPSASGSLHCEKHQLLKASSKNVGRNAQCPCGSGKKNKRCHGAS